MTRLLFALLLATMALAQATVFPAINILGVEPNITLVLILVWSAVRGVPEGVIWALPLGLFLDLIALDPLGSNALALIPVAVIGGLARRRLFHSGVIFPMLLVVLATLVHRLVESIVAASVGVHLSLGISVRLGLLTALLNMALVPLFYLIVMALERLGVVRAARA